MKTFFKGKKSERIKKIRNVRQKKSHKNRKDFEITLGHMYLFIIKYIL